MPQTANRLNGFTESVIREMTRLSLQHGAINLAQGFPDFEPPAELLAGLREAIPGPNHQYAVTWGAPKFRAALAHKISYWTGAQVDPDENLVVTCGSTEAMMVAMMTACNPGDKVIIFSPFYENYAADAILCGACPIHVPLEPPDFAINEARLLAAFQERPKAIVVCNPSNPSGKVFSRAELIHIGELATEHDAFIITDEVYEHILYAPHTHTYTATLPGLAERTITCSSLSKTYSITGWRLGYVWAAAKVIRAARKVHDFLTVGAASVLQEAAVTALQLPPEYYHRLQNDYTSKKTLFLQILREAQLTFIEPQGAYYVLVELTPLGWKNDVEAARWFIESLGVAGVPGSSFFREPTRPLLRLHFAKKEETLKLAGEKLKRIGQMS